MASCHGIGGGGHGMLFHRNNISPSAGMAANVAMNRGAAAAAFSPLT